MKNEKKIEHELIAELESAYQKVYKMEAQLKKYGQKEGDAVEHYHTLSDVHDSEIRYRRLFEAAKDGILILDADSGAITDANPYIHEILGYLPQELVGKRLWEIGAFFDVVASKAAFEELQKKEYIRYENLPLQTKDGQLREVEFISNVYEVDLKKVIQCNIRNITKRKEAIKALEESAIRYQRLFESAKDGLLILDAETGKIIDANPFLLEILNFSQEEVIGKELWEIGSFKEIIANKDTFRKLQLQEYFHYEPLLLQNKKGVSIHVEFMSTYYSMNERKVIQCNIRNITKRKEAEEVLKASEIRYRRLFESAKDGLLILDAETGRIIDANPFLLEILNYSREEIVGKDLREIEPFENVIASQDVFRKLQYHEYNHFEHLLLQNKEGVNIHVEFVSSFYFENKRKVVQCHIRDITQRKWLEEDRHNLTNKLQEAFAHIKELKGMLPMCANCKKIRNDKGYWQAVEGYISEHTDATFTHGMCPDCMESFYPKQAHGNLEKNTGMK